MSAPSFIAFRPPTADEQITELEDFEFTIAIAGELYAVERDRDYGDECARPVVWFRDEMIAEIDRLLALFVGGELPGLDGRRLRFSAIGAVQT